MNHATVASTMSDLESRLAQFRREHSGTLDRFVYQDRAELVDLDPGSPGAARVIRDLDQFAHRSSVARLLTLHLLGCLPGTAGREARVLEICAGTGWLGRDLASHAGREGRPVALLATDLHGPRSALGSVGTWCRADATRLPFRGQAFDLVICSMALHHFKPREVVRLLREAVRVGRRVCIFDLRRTLYGVAMVGLIAPAFSREFVRDAIRSHRRAYHIREMRFLIEQAGLPLRVREFFSYGMLIESIGLEGAP